jgi:hypothetical protein
MNQTLKKRPLVAPKLGKAEARERLQQHVELMDLLREVQRRMVAMSPNVDDCKGTSFTGYYRASEAWEAHLRSVRTLYDEVERLAVAINLQAL